jgi:hypothetical protein
MNSKKSAPILEVDGLAALRGIVGKKQTEFAVRMGVRQSSLYVLETQKDIRVSTLRRYVEAAGGTLELRVSLPGEPPIRLTGLGHRP